MSSHTMAQKQRMPRFLTHCFHIPSPLPPRAGFASFQEVHNLKILNQRSTWQGHVDPE